MYRLIWRLIWVPAIALAACGAEDYQRPRTVEYITQAILAPSCGNAQCHSALSHEANYKFDTVEDAQQSLLGLVGAISLDAQDEPEGDASTSFLINVLTRVRDRMPYDQPLPDPDIDLISSWIDFGAPGAQCIPQAGGGPVCAGSKVVDCKPDFNYGAVERDCATTMMGCSNGACR
jgi:hypothetical protein